MVRPNNERSNNVDAADTVSIELLEQRLADAEFQHEMAVSGSRSNHADGTGAYDYAAGWNQIKLLERELALARGTEAAVAIEWPVPWSTGAPMPHVLAAGYRTFLLYLAAEHPVGPLGTADFPIEIDPESNVVQPIAIVEFTDCDAVRFGGPNDEGLHHHPLYHAGLDYYEAHLVANSRWLAATRAIDSFRADDDPNRWHDHKHYLLTFHDELFECLATGHRIEMVRASFADAFEIARRRVFEPENWAVLDD